MLSFIISILSFLFPSGSDCAWRYVDPGLYDENYREQDPDVFLDDDTDYCDYDWERDYDF